MNERTQKGILLFFIIALSGCGRVTDWGKKAFYQGEQLSDLVDIPQHYVQQVVVHDQVRTEAKFVALWISADPVISAYVNIYARRYGLSEQEKQKIFEDKKKEYEGKIVFYVLSLYNVPLGNPESEWGLFLKSAHHIIQPESVKDIELAPEYKAFFGKDLTLFKDAYMVTFATTQKDITKRVCQTMSLYFRSVEKEVLLSWNLMGPPLTFEDDIRRKCPWHVCPQERT